MINQEEDFQQRKASPSRAFQFPTFAPVDISQEINSANFVPQNIQELREALKEKQRIIVSLQEQLNKEKNEHTSALKQKETLIQSLIQESSTKDMLIFCLRKDINEKTKENEKMIETLIQKDEEIAMWKFVEQYQSSGSIPNSSKVPKPEASMKNSNDGKGIPEMTVPVYKEKIAEILKKLTSFNIDKICSEILSFPIIIPSEEAAKVLALLLTQVIVERALCKDVDSATIRNIAELCRALYSQPPKKNLGVASPFRRVLINYCNKKFKEMMDKRQWTEGTGEFSSKQIKMSFCEFLGQLFMVKCLIPNIIAEIVEGILPPGAAVAKIEDVECVAQLLKIVGKEIEKDAPSKQFDRVFELFHSVSSNTGTPSEIRSKLVNLIELRENKWEDLKNDEKVKDNNNKKSKTESESAPESDDSQTESESSCIIA